MWLQPSMLAAMQRYYADMSQISIAGNAAAAAVALASHFKPKDNNDTNQSSSPSPSTNNKQNKSPSTTEVRVPSSKPRFGSAPNIKTNDHSPSSAIKKRNDRCQYCAKVRF